MKKSMKLGERFEKTIGGEKVLMMMVSTRDLKGASLDYSVTRIECKDDPWKPGITPAPFSSDASWSQEVVEREKISVYWDEIFETWRASSGFSFLMRDQDGHECTIASWGNEQDVSGRTFLVAAMRQHVVKNFGELIAVPVELL